MVLNNQPQWLLCTHTEAQASPTTLLPLYTYPSFTRTTIHLDCGLSVQQLEKACGWDFSFGITWGIREGSPKSCRTQYNWRDRSCHVVNLIYILLAAEINGHVSVFNSLNTLGSFLSLKSSPSLDFYDTALSGFFSCFFGHLCLFLSCSVIVLFFFSLSNILIPRIYEHIHKHIF